MQSNLDCGSAALIVVTGVAMLSFNDSAGREMQLLNSVFILSSHYMAIEL